MPKEEDGTPFSVSDYQQRAGQDAEKQKEDWEEALTDDYPDATSIVVAETKRTYGPFVVSHVGGTTDSEMLDVRQTATVSYRAQIEEEVTYVDDEGNEYHDIVTRYRSRTFTGVVVERYSSSHIVIEGTEGADSIVLDGIITTSEVHGHGVTVHGVRRKECCDAGIFDWREAG